MVSHTTTGEWQSFEGRMRRRKAERLALRADVAADAGCVEEAREALAEARALWPSAPELDRIQAKLDAPPDEPLGIPAPFESTALPHEVESPPVADTPSRGSGRFIAAAAAVALLGGAAAYVSSAVTADRALQPTQEFREFVPGVAAAATATVIPRSEPAAVPEPEPQPPLATPAPVSTSGSYAGGSTGETRPEPARRDERVLPASLNTASEIPRSAPTAPPPAPITVPDPPIANPSPAPPLERFAPRETEAARPPSLRADTLSTTPGVSSAPPEPVVSQDTLVRATLDRYAAAYSALDADAAQRVWPTVNRGALSRAFDSLSSQRVLLGSCSIDVNGGAAQARCAGTTTWRPKVGTSETKTDRRAWTFELAKAGAGWEIVSARVQNR